ncbi:MAG: D-alanyl-D-alanine carboxypeptidase family protein [Pseudomonadota bacterium]
MRTWLLILTALCLSACSTVETLDVAPIPGNQRYASIVVDVKTGRVLEQTSADRLRYPASLTKMMTVYMIFDGLSSGRFSTSTEIPVSANAASKQASKLWLKAGSTITIDKAIRALVVKSANDVATAVAEYLGGTEERFAQLMTTKARSLGMSSTVFQNASGLPDADMRTTARDMAKLSLALQKNHAQYYGYFGLTSFEHNGKRITGHNNVLKSYRGATGLKTGYTRASGSNLATSAKRNGRSVVAIVLGGNGARERDDQMKRLLDAVFDQ